MTPEIRDILKILCKKEISPLFHKILLPVVGLTCKKNGTRFSLPHKRLFEINEFEITRVDCIHILLHDNTKNNAEYFYSPNFGKVEGGVHIASALFVRLLVTLFLVCKISQKVFDLGLRYLSDLLGLMSRSPD